MKKSISYLIFTLLIVLGLAQYSDAENMEADLAFTNGKVITVDRDFSIKQAIAVKNGWILAVGTNKDIERFVGKKTQVIDLKGSPILPGINDSHCHTAAFASVIPPFALEVKYPAVKSIKDIQANIAAKVKTLKPGEWIRGRGYNEDFLEECKADKNRKLTKKDLDAVAPNNPVVIMDWGGHNLWVNSKVLEMAGITRDTPDPHGGRVVKDAAGEPTGILQEVTAFSLVMKVVPLFDLEQTKQLILSGMAEMNKNGITSYTEPLGPGADLNESGIRGSKVIEGYRQLYKEGKLTARVQIPILYGKYGSVTYDDIVQGSEKYQFPADVDPYWVRNPGIKIFADGIPPIKTAWMWEPYVSGGHGSLIIPGATDQERYDQLIKMIGFAHDRGWQVAVHAVGDRAISATIDGFEKAILKKPWTLARHSIIHADFITPKDAQRAAQYNIGIASQPMIQAIIADSEAKFVGPERAAYEFPHKTELSAGIHVSFGSDAAVSYPNWRRSIQAAVLREGEKSGKVSGPEQRITREEAIRAYTINGAWQGHMETVKGSIEVNKLADFCVLGQDILSVDDHKIKDVPVLMTIVGGKIVYKAPEGLFK